MSSFFVGSVRLFLKFECSGVGTIRVGESAGRLGRVARGVCMFSYGCPSAGFSLYNVSSQICLLSETHAPLEVSSEEGLATSNQRWDSPILNAFCGLVPLPPCADLSSSFCVNLKENLSENWVEILAPTSQFAVSDWCL